jgi:pimeloyl-ACP methyl ester carboxylesterase
MLKTRALLIAAVAAAAVAIAAMPASAGASLYVPYGTEALVEGAWNETWDPTALSGGNNNCKPSAAHPYPVVLVHATFADEGSNWVTLAPLLANAGYCVYAFNYGETILSGLLGSIDGLNHITQSAEELNSFVNKVLSKTKASQVDLVGHSQGGMMPNYYLKYLGGASKVNTFVGLAPSNHGTTLDGLKELIDNFPFASLAINVFLEGRLRLREEDLRRRGHRLGAALRGHRDDPRRGRHALHQRVPERLERDQHHDPEPVPERPGRSHRDVRGLARDAERAQPAQREPEPVVHGDVLEIRVEPVGLVVG